MDWKRRIVSAHSGGAVDAIERADRTSAPAGSISQPAEGSVTGSAVAGRGYRYPLTASHHRAATPAREEQEDAGEQGEDANGRVDDDGVRPLHVDVKEPDVGDALLGEERDARDQQGNDAQDDQD